MRLMIAAMIVLIGLGGAGSAKADDKADFQTGLKAARAGDFAGALREWRPLAERGFEGAQSNLGLMYYKGSGVPQDYTKAAKWFRKAAERSDATAQYNLGYMYSIGQGIPQDYAKAVKWLRKAADQGNANAQSNLGVIYANGAGVLQDSVLAHMWFNMSGANGNKKGPDNRARIEKSMTPAQIAEAQKLARECMAKKYKGCGR
jgi:uncharacterized protein